MADMTDMMFTNPGDDLAPSDAFATRRAIVARIQKEMLSRWALQSSKRPTPRPPAKIEALEDFMERSSESSSPGSIAGPLEINTFTENYRFDDESESGDATISSLSCSTSLPPRDFCPNTFESKVHHWNIRMNEGEGRAYFSGLFPFYNHQWRLTLTDAESGGSSWALILSCFGPHLSDTLHLSVRISVVTTSYTADADGEVDYQCLKVHGPAFPDKKLIEIPNEKLFPAPSTLSCLGSMGRLAHVTLQLSL